jgi:hypothetical protein
MSIKNGAKDTEETKDTKENRTNACLVWLVPFVFLV